MYFVFDVDGTICFNGSFIEEDILNALEEINKSHNLIFASARPIRDLIPVLPNFKNNLLIGGNGSIISDKGDIKVIDYISSHEYVYLKQLIEEYNLNFIIDGSFNYSAKVDSNNIIYKQLDPMKLAKNIPFKEIERPIKVILVNIPEKLYEEIVQKLDVINSNITINYHRKDFNIDITAKGVNKYTTLKEIIGNSNYIGYGNDINDYDLLKNAYKSYYISQYENTNLDFGITEILPKNSKKIALSIQSHNKMDIKKF
ncbi:HAD family hydrolase [Staphylococcus epidermidis]|uniref:HAD hydrolase family protein n=1 Tax=Staphylococcus epidermidis TaxID=1282 RepID=UPI00209652E1|nr:HAD family hydrolase [Staphylococcus epidermidis]